MRVLNVTKSISFDKINDVTRFNNIDVSSLYVDKKDHSSAKKKTCKSVKWIENALITFHYKDLLSKSKLLYIPCFSTFRSTETVYYLSTGEQKVICNRC